MFASKQINKHLFSAIWITPSILIMFNFLDFEYFYDWNMISIVCINYTPILINRAHRHPLATWFDRVNIMHTQPPSPNPPQIYVHRRASQVSVVSQLYESRSNRFTARACVLINDIDGPACASHRPLPLPQPQTTCAGDERCARIDCVTHAR